MITRLLTLFLFTLVAGCTGTARADAITMEQIKEKDNCRCNLDTLSSKARQAAIERYPHSTFWRDLPTVIVRTGSQIEVTYKLPKGMRGGTPRIIFDADTCEIVDIYHEQ